LRLFPQLIGTRLSQFLCELSQLLHLLIAIFYSA
jgi:hypothetical protein